MRKTSRRTFIKKSTAGAALLVPMHAIFKPYGVSDARGLKYAHGIHENLDGEAILDGEADPL